MITSVQNSQIKNVQLLQKKSSERKSQGLFVVEGEKMFLECLKYGTVDKVYFSEGYYEHKSAEKGSFLQDGDILKNTQVELVSDTCFKAMCETVTPQGVIALVRIPGYDIEELMKNARALLVLEGLQDPGNLGTIMRTAEAAGMGGIILSDTSVDLFNPKVVRATMGAIFRMPAVYVADIFGTVKRLNKLGFNTLATHLSATHDYTHADYSGKTAILVGNEGNGLSAELTELAREKIIIPMEGEVESLNAAVAAALCMYEVKRNSSLHSS